MAFSIGNMFRSTQQVQQPQQGGNQQQVPQQQQPQQQQPQTQDPSGGTGQPGSSMQQPNSGSGVPQNSPQGNEGGQSQNSPLDAFKDLWQSDPKDKAPTDPFATPLLNLDPAKFQEAASRMDFLSNMPPDLVQKVMSGNDPQALLELINRVGQQSFAMAGQLAVGSTNRAGSDLAGRFKQSMPDMFKQYMLQNEQPEHPILSHPTAQPMLQMAMQQIQMKEPHLKPPEIRKKAEKFLVTFAESMNAGKGEGTPGFGGNAGQSKEQDWDAWASS